MAASGRAAAIAETSVDGSGLIDELLGTATNWRDYECISELDYYKGKEPQKQSCKFYYKDKQVRIEIKGGGYRDGSVVVKRKDGSIRGKGGMMMAYITMNLDPDSRMLILPNGINVMKSDLPDLLSDLKKQVERGLRAKATPAPVTEPGIASKVLILEVLDGTTQTARIIVDAEQRVPIRWDLYTNGQFLSSAWFRNLRTDVGLDDKLFRL